jgi:hypothetical protein
MIFFQHHTLMIVYCNAHKRIRKGNTMDINKIHVTVDKKDYTGLYWLEKVRGKDCINVYYEGLKKSSSYIKGGSSDTTDKAAKQILSELIGNM